MKIMLYKQTDSHRHWYSGFFEYLRLKGHTALIHAGRPPRRLGADRVVIWNGNHPRCKFVASMCERQGIPFVFMEVGFFPQRDYYMLSRRGSVGGNLFEGERIPVLPTGGEAWLQNQFARYAGEGVIKSCRNAKRDYVAGFLQLPYDKSIVNHSPFSTMQQVVDAASARWPGENIVWKVHPKQRRPGVSTDHPLYRGVSIWPHILKSKRCVAVNSTTLYEAALAGVPVTALGDCPLSRHPDRHREIVHEILMRQIPVGVTDIEDKVVRSIGDGVF